MVSICITIVWIVLNYSMWLKQSCESHFIWNPTPSLCGDLGSQGFSNRLFGWNSAMTSENPRILQVCRLRFRNQTWVNFEFENMAALTNKKRAQPLKKNSLDKPWIYSQGCNRGKSRFSLTIPDPKHIYIYTYCWWFRNPKANHLGWC